MLFLIHILQTINDRLYPLLCFFLAHSLLFLSFFLLGGFYLKDFQGPVHAIDHDLFSIQLKRKKGFHEMKQSHSHQFYEIYYLRRGERNYFINGKLYPIKSGDVVVLNPYDVHRTTSSKIEEFERVLIYFKSEFLFDDALSTHLRLLPFSPDAQIVRFPPQKQAYIEKLIFKMLYECTQKRRGFHIYLKSLLTNLLIKIYRQSLSPIYQMNKPNHKQIEQITTYLNQNYDKALTLDLVSEQFCLSKYYLSRMFKKHTGFNFSEYIQSIRIREARHQLLETNKKVSEIAKQVGFTSIAHFNKVFKKHTNTSPSKYRRQFKHLAFQT